MSYQIFEIDDKGILNHIDRISYRDRDDAWRAVRHYDQEGLHDNTPNTVWGKRITVLEVKEY